MIQAAACAVFTLAAAFPAAAQPAGGEVARPTRSAVAVLHPTDRHQVSGTVWFTEVENGVHIRVDLENLDPGKHGFHIHEYGDCTAGDASSAGGHYAPRGYRHGGPDDVERHMGDLGNVTADGMGRVRVEMIDPVLSLEGRFSLVGRAVVVHAGEDDLTSQPAGAAGPRVACGVIGWDEGN